MSKKDNSILSNANLYADAPKATTFARRLFTPYFTFIMGLLVSTILEITKVSQDTKFMEEKLLAIENVDNPLVITFDPSFLTYGILLCLIVMAISFVWFVIDLIAKMVKKEKLSLFQNVEIAVITLVGLSIAFDPGILPTERDVAWDISSTYSISNADFDKETNLLTGRTDAAELEIPITETTAGLSRTFTIELPQEISPKIELAQAIKSDLEKDSE